MFFVPETIGGRPEPFKIRKFSDNSCFTDILEQQGSDTPDHVRVKSNTCGNMATYRRTFRNHEEQVCALSTVRPYVSANAKNACQWRKRRRKAKQSPGAKKLENFYIVTVLKEQAVRSMRTLT